MSEVENQEAPEVVLTTMPGADNHPMDDDQTGMSLDFTEEAEPEAAPEAEPEAEPEAAPEPEPVAAEAEAEPEAKVEPELEPEPEKKSPMIPKARLDEALQKQKALQRQLEQMQQAMRDEDDVNSKIEEPGDYDFATKEMEYQELLLDGEAKQAADLRLEINSQMYKSVLYDVQQSATQLTKQTLNETAEQNTLQATADNLAKMYPALDENSDVHNPAALEEVIDLRDAFIQRGYEPADALVKSVNYVVKANDIAQTGAAPTPQNTQDEVAKKRAEVQRKLEAAEAQPPEMMGESGANKGEKTLSVESLSDDEFAALPEATLARLRGDIL